MRELAVSTPVRAPAGFALAFLNAYVQSRTNGSGEAHFRLRVPLERHAGTTLEHDVMLHVDWLQKEPGEAARLAVDWRPADAHDFLSFEGTIEATPASRAACTLAIRGRYRAPLGIIGRLFDAFAGTRIARASVADLLRFFRSAIEADYLERIGSY